VVVSDHAEAARELRCARIFQHASIGTYGEWQLLGIWRVAFDQRPCISVLVRVKDLMRIAVAREKILQAHQIRVQCGPDQNRAASAVLDQGDPAQDERPHDPLAEFGFCDDDAAQMLGGNE
jgi:hypothetical protein